MAVVVSQNRIRRLKPRVMILLGPDKSPTPTPDPPPTSLRSVLRPESLRSSVPPPPGAFGVEPSAYYLHEHLGAASGAPPPGHRRGHARAPPVALSVGQSEQAAVRAFGRIISSRDLADALLSRFDLAEATVGFEPSCGPSASSWRGSPSGISPRLGRDPGWWSCGRSAI